MFINLFIFGFEVLCRIKSYQIKFSEDSHLTHLISELWGVIRQQASVSFIGTANDSHGKKEHVSHGKMILKEQKEQGSSCRSMEAQGRIPKAQTCPALVIDDQDDIEEDHSVLQ